MLPTSSTDEGVGELHGLESKRLALTDVPLEKASVCMTSWTLEIIVHKLPATLLYFRDKGEGFIPSQLPSVSCRLWFWPGFVLKAADELSEKLRSDPCCEISSPDVAFPPVTTSCGREE